MIIEIKDLVWALAKYPPDRLVLLADIKSGESKPLVVYAIELREEVQGDDESHLFIVPGKQLACS